MGQSKPGKKTTTLAKVEGEAKNFKPKGKIKKMSLSQNQLIKAALENGESLTPMDALRRFGCFRLGARIADLKKQGLNITTTMENDGNKRFARYRLEA